jgi:hypothetical protein
MDKWIEQLGKGRTVLLDSSFFQPAGDIDLCRQLYSVGGLKSLPIQAVENRMERVYEIEKIVRSYDVCLIEEVERERIEFQKQMDGHFNFFRKVHKGKVDFRNKGRHYKKNVINRRKSWNSDLEDKLEILGVYCKRFYSLFKKIRNTDPRNGFSEEQRRMYGFLYGIVEDCSRKGLKAADWKKINNSRNPLMIGNKLRTDQHIVATGMTLAYRQPVLILTRDVDIPETAKRVLDRLIFQDGLEKLGFAGTPPDALTTYGTRTYEDSTGAYSTDPIPIIGE